MPVLSTLNGGLARQHRSDCACTHVFFKSGYTKRRIVLKTCQVRIEINSADDFATPARRCRGRSGRVNGRWSPNGSRKMEGWRKLRRRFVMSWVDLFARFWCIFAHHKQQEKRTHTTSVRSGTRFKKPARNDTPLNRREKRILVFMNFSLAGPPYNATPTRKTRDVVYSVQNNIVMYGDRVFFFRLVLAAPRYAHVYDINYKLFYTHTHHV